MQYNPEPAARVCYAAIRQLREEQGCGRGPVWELLVQEEKGWVVQAVERARAGMFPRQIQEAWRDEMLDMDWKPGPEIDHARRTHPELEEWGDLAKKFRDRFCLLQIMVAGMEFSHLMGGLPAVIAP